MKIGNILFSKLLQKTLTSYEFIPDEELSEKEIDEIKEGIEKSILFLEENLSRILSYIYKEKELGNYIEIDIPLFESNLSIKVNLFYEKILLSIMNHKDSKFFGYLIIDGIDSLDKEGIKKIATLSSPIHNFKRYTLS